MASGSRTSTSGCECAHTSLQPAQRPVGIAKGVVARPVEDQSPEEPIVVNGHVPGSRAVDPHVGPREDLSRGYLVVMQPPVTTEYVEARRQVEVLEEHPAPFLRGLFHSDGCRVDNWATRTVRGEKRAASSSSPSAPHAAWRAPTRTG